MSNSYFNTDPPSLYKPHPPRPYSFVRPLRSSVLQNIHPVVTLLPSRLAHLRQQVKYNFIPL